MWHLFVLLSWIYSFRPTSESVSAFSLTWTLPPRFNEMVDGRPVYRTLNDRYYLDLIAVTQIFAGDLVIKKSSCRASQWIGFIMNSWYRLSGNFTLWYMIRKLISVTDCFSNMGTNIALLFLHQWMMRGETKKTVTLTTAILVSCYLHHCWWRVQQYSWPDILA